MNAPPRYDPTDSAAIETWSVLESLAEVDSTAWDALAGAGRPCPPFLRHDFLRALELGGCVDGDTGWQTRHLVGRGADGRLQAALPLYGKSHSWGEYVFDWAWADAYERHGLNYYPKLLSAIPFTPVTGPRLLVGGTRPVEPDALKDGAAVMPDPGRLHRQRDLVGAALSLARQTRVSSWHVLYPEPDEVAALTGAGLMLRRGVQFHWYNQGFADFEAFLTTLAQPKRKKIRAERRKVAEAGVRIERLRGDAISEADWRFFYRCYQTTYRQHRSSPYLSLDFFLRLARQMPAHLLMAVARRDGRPIATSLVLLDEERLYGRYWGAVEHIPCLHFELAYYQSIEAAIELGLRVIEGGAQGEHKMARGFVPVATHSAHWLSEPAFAEAVDDFLRREGRMIDGYLDELAERTPFRSQPGEDRSAQPPLPDLPSA